MQCFASLAVENFFQAEAAIAALIACTALLLTAVICGTVLRDFAHFGSELGTWDSARCCEARRS